MRAACATPGAGSTIAPSNIIPIVLNCMPASQFKGSPNNHTLSERLLEWPASCYWLVTMHMLG
jgi:hypothetical protein